MFTDTEVFKLLDALVAARAMKPHLAHWRDATEEEWEALFEKVEKAATVTKKEAALAPVRAAAPETMVGWA
jgi:diadenosine tetraphosphate (Ap4A) HIT family hydrolase